MIAIFDSGYGGLTVFKPIVDLLPQYDYLYLGDNARVPYGNHSEENIKLFTEQAVDYLFKNKVKLIILGCNTASSVALRYLQEKYLKGKKEKDRKILGVLMPVTEEAINLTKNKRIGVVGTKAT
ncbi:MAG: glutamate racemase, partial [Candidatus Gracilibacteria bacterium]